jgi:hypothetical protein
MTSPARAAGGDLPHERVRLLRMSGQMISSPAPGGPARVVEAMGAIQSQDYRMAKWAVGLRAADCSESDVERAFDRGDFLRIHVLRPTWHFVSKRDARWMLGLTAPNV